MENRKIIMLTKFGSHLYGTDTESSDQDFKGIFLPTKKEILLGKIPKSIHADIKISDSLKNTSSDVDKELYSLHYFIDLACDGETAAIDMLHAPNNMLLESSGIWEYIVANREKFYTKNLKSFIGYAKRQAAKYGVKGSRLRAASIVLDIINNFINPDKDIRLKYIWDILPEIEYAHKLPPDNNGIRQYDVCGRKIGETASLEYAYNVIKHFYDSYGKRAKLAEKNEGIDWKAISHALRAAFQLKHLYLEGTIKFPLPEADLLKLVKSGKLDYNTEAAVLLDELLDEVEELASASSYPEKVDKIFWDNFIMDAICEEYFA